MGKDIFQLFMESGQKFESETLVGTDGCELTVIFFSHASLAFIWNGNVVYVDPLMEYADYSLLPKADVILVTHEHYDHLDVEAVAQARKDSTVVAGSRSVADLVEGVNVFPYGTEYKVGEGIAVESVPAYNVSPHQLQFHPQEKQGNGYILTLGPTRIYIAGDTEPIPEMEHLGLIDIAFLPVNQPYTMTPKQAAEAARTVGAPIFYPYHTTDTDTDTIKRELTDFPAISVIIHNMP